MTRHHDAKGALLAGILCACAISNAMAQGRLEDYQRAEQFVAGNLARLTHRLALTAHWIGPDSDEFWYLEEADSAGVEGTKRFVLVDADTGSTQAAFDHARLAAAINKRTAAHHSGGKLPFDHLDELQPRKKVEFTIASEAWRCNLQTYSCEKAEPSVATNSAEALSADRRWAIGRNGDDLYLRDRRSGRTRSLTTDGEPANGYAGQSGFTPLSEKLTGKSKPPMGVFSADSSKLFTYRLDTREVGKLQVLQTVPGARPVAHSYSHPLPGDAQIAKAELMVFDLGTGARVNLARPPSPVAATYDSLVQEEMKWNASGTRVYYIESDRGYKTTALHMAEARTGKDSVLLQERSDTYVAPSPILRPVGNGETVIWSSERDGWNHLYLVDGDGAGIKRQLTSGPWVVFDVAHVDAGRRWVYFTAGGRETGRDPYYRHLYRISLDGGEPQLLTPEDADHSIGFSPTGKYFVDTYSRMDLPAVSLLRRADGKQVRELQRADIAALLKTGWRVPEQFTVKARDGVTDLYGVILRPSNFDPERKYPVLDAIYPGPQIISTPKSFSPAGRNRSQELPLAELGFIVVVMDGMGTPLRSRAFREVSYGALGDAGGLEEHVAGLRQLASRYPYMDMERVGIYGHSGGGYAAARAILKYPDFYKVAVASAGNHDTRAYWTEWGERYQGFPVDDGYDAQANAPLAAQLKGKLLLVHGALDDNVHPAHTLGLVDALIEANKDFDLLILPNRDHGLINLGNGRQATDGLDLYFVRKRWDYFVRHLMGVEPPHEYRIRTPAG